MNKLMSEFVACEAEYKALEEKRTALREKIVAQLQKEGIEKVEDTIFGTFTVAHKVTYTYSPAVTKIEERLKIAKEKDVQKGTAKVKSDTAYLRYTEPKA